MLHDGAAILRLARLLLAERLSAAGKENGGFLAKRADRGGCVPPLTNLTEMEEYP